MQAQRRQVLFERVEQATQLPMLLLALVFVALVLLPELVELSAEALNVLEGVLWMIWGLFATELVIKTYLAPHRRRYLVTHWIDVVTVLLPVLRPLRLLALVVAGLRFWTEARTAMRRTTLSFIGISSLIAVVAASAMVYVAERGGEGPIQNYWDALWWAASTITTVGYGDMYPKTPTGRGVAVLLMLIGISTFGLLTARVAAFFVEADEAEAKASDPRLTEIALRLSAIEARLTGNQIEGGDASQDAAEHDEQRTPVRLVRKPADGADKDEPRTG